MTLVEVQVKWSVILMDRFGPDNFSTLQRKGHVLHRARAHLKVPAWLLVWNALLTKKLPMFFNKKIVSSDSTRPCQCEVTNEERSNVFVITSSNQRLWKCVRRRINCWLSTSKNQPFFIESRGFTERYFSDNVYAILAEEVPVQNLRCVTAPVSVDSQV